MSKELGSLISSMRKKKGITQRELGNLVGIAQTQISCIEKGITNSRMETLQKICEVLDLDEICVLRAAGFRLAVSPSNLSIEDELLINQLISVVDNLSKRDKDIIRLIISGD